jgi:renalase
VSRTGAAHELKVAIVGAGAAGLAAAWALRNTPAQVTLFEQSKELGGRAKTRLSHGVALDLGANFLKAEPQPIEDLIHQLPTEQLEHIPGPVWTFDRDNHLKAGDTRIDGSKKWTYRDGIQTLAKLIFEEARADLRLETRIHSLSRIHEQWWLDGGDRGQFGGFDQVLLTAPAPHAIELLRASTLSDGIAEPVLQGLAQARYHKQWCFSFCVEAGPEDCVEWFALLNADREHPLIAWLERENGKPDRVPAEKTVMNVQLQPEWSAAHFDHRPEDLLPQVVEAVEALLQWTPRPILWWDCQRWDAAHPFEAADGGLVAESEWAGLFIAGDAMIGKGRVNLALLTGLEVAKKMSASLPGLAPD